MKGMYHFGSMTELLALLVLGIGYIVLYFAKREEKELQLIGYVIGAGLIILSLIYLLNSLNFGMGYNRNSLRCREDLIKKSMLRQERMLPPHK